MIIGFEWGLGEFGRMVEETETPMIYELVLSLALIYNLHEHIEISVTIPFSSSIFRPQILLTGLPQWSRSDAGFVAADIRTVFLQLGHCEVIV